MNINNFIKFAETNFQPSHSPDEYPQELSRLTGDNLFMNAYSNFKDQAMEHPIFKLPYHNFMTKLPVQSKFSLINAIHPHRFSND